MTESDPTGAEPRLIGISGIKGELTTTQEPPYLEAADNQPPADGPAEAISASLDVHFNPIVVGRADGTVQPIENYKSLLMRHNPKDRAKIADAYKNGNGNTNGNHSNGTRP